ncbi:MAG: DUF3501 family protein [Gammaproteobacteria bacterium]|nr:DUF3501 family protein [Gammaproteobacteria bacterium]
MEKLDRSSLWSLEQYSEARQAFRAQVIAHKKPRRVAIGRHATLIFEDALTMKYQIQEMLRIEKIFEAAEIDEELAAYNPLIPDGGNWKATLMIEYPDVEERQRALATMGGIEDTIWVQAEGAAKVYAIANEDMERSTDGKAAAVHFLRFELDPASVTAIKAGAPIKAGIDHDALREEVQLNPATIASLSEDLD